MDKRRTGNGFTLVEMSVVLIIIGLVIVIVYPALVAVRQATQQSTTTSNLNTLLRATAAFVQANGCVPCPTKASATGGRFGRVRGDLVNAPCGACSDPAEGIPPFVSLGIPASVAKDGWGRWITMRVDPSLTTAFNVIPPTSVCLASDPSPCILGESRKGLCRADLANTTTHPTVQLQGGAIEKAAIVFISHGTNGYGTYRSSPLSPPDDGNFHPPYGGGTASCAIGNYELCNSDNDRTFNEGLYPTLPDIAYDDQLAYLSRNALVSYLGNPSCQTPW